MIHHPTLHLLLGPAGSGKTTQAVRTALNHLQAGHPVHVLHQNESLYHPWTVTLQHPKITFNSIDSTTWNPEDIPLHVQHSIQVLTQQTKRNLWIIDDLIRPSRNPSLWECALSDAILQGHSVLLLQHVHHHPQHLHDLQGFLSPNLLQVILAVQEKCNLPNITFEWCTRIGLEPGTNKLQDLQLSPLVSAPHLCKPGQGK